MADELPIRLARREDEPRLGALFETCFGIDIGPEYFEWKHRANPAGEAIVSVTEVGDRIVGSHTVIPEPWTVGGGAATIYQAGDVMVHPDFQRRGLFVRLAQNNFAEIRHRMGQCEAIGVAGYNSLPGTLKMSWALVREIAPLVVPTALARLRRRVRADGVTVQAISGSDSRVHHVLAHAYESAGAAKPRLEGEFFDWRVFGASPKRLHAALVCKRGEPLAVGVYGFTTRRTTLLSYVAGLDGPDGRDWFGPLVRFAARGRGGVLYTWEPEQEWLASLCRQLGFRRYPLAKGPLSTHWFLTSFSDTGFVNGVPWDGSTEFDVQPLMLD